ncbi:MAG: aminopeptidase [Prolixibacteraceae bacterium]|nr:aminopeptidase [Prolixibacteraceae bacterium]
MEIKGLITLLFLLFTLNVLKAQENNDSQDKSGYKITDVISIPVTSIKDQNKSSTCWSYSSLSFLESELLRNGGPQVDLSEMFIVWHCYKEKAEKYARMHGNINFGPGGAFHDAIWVMKNYGLVPESAFKGLKEGDELPVHSEMDEVLKSYMNGVVKNVEKRLSPVWHDTFKDMLNNYLGEVPDKFIYNGVEYTPKTFVSNYLKLKADDYIEIGSFTHHPFYEKFILEVPDNWLWDEIYNVPLQEMIEIIDYALISGYTVAWGADVSDKGFATKTKGIAVIPDINVEDLTESDLVRWQGMSKEKKDEELYKLDKPGKEKVITQEMKQTDFDNHLSTDDHGMHIIGMAKDQNGTEYYKVKNSWGNYNIYEGYFYASKSYVALKTIDFMIHKNAVPPKIKAKLGL